MAPWSGCSPFSWTWRGSEEATGPSLRPPGIRGPPTTGLELAWPRTYFSLYQLHSTNVNTKLRASMGLMNGSGRVTVERSMVRLTGTP